MLPFDEQFVHWTIRLSIACYLIFIVQSLLTTGEQRTKRIVWTVGLGLFLAHMFSALGVFHDWSHWNAVEHTAKITNEVVGINWGGGVYFNYLFAALWTADVCLWWIIGLGWPTQSHKFQIGLHIYFAFIAINSTVVFGPNYWRPIALGFVILVGAFWWVRNSAQKISSQGHD